MTDKEIIKCAKGFVAGILDGSDSTHKCFMVCAPLAAYLSVLRIECTATEGEVIIAGEGWHHFWITLADGRIIDPTADQFGLKNIYLKPKPSFYRPYTEKDLNDKINSAVKRFQVSAAKKVLP